MTHRVETKIIKSRIAVAPPARDRDATASHMPPALTMKTTRKRRIEDDDDDDDDSRSRRSGNEYKDEEEEHLYVLSTYIISNQLVKRLIYVYQQLLTTQISVTCMY